MLLDDGFCEEGRKERLGVPVDVPTCFDSGTLVTEGIVLFGDFEGTFEGILVNIFVGIFVVIFEGERVVGKREGNIEGLVDSVGTYVQKGVKLVSWNFSILLVVCKMNLQLDF